MADRNHRSYWHPDSEPSCSSPTKEAMEEEMAELEPPTPEELGLWLKLKPEPRDG